MAERKKSNVTDIREYANARKRRTAMTAASAGRRNGQTVKNFPNNKRQKKRFKKNDTRLLFLGGVVVLTIVLIFAFATRKNGLEVFVGETSIGILKGKSVTVEDLSSTVSAQLEAERGSKIALNEKISVEPIHISKKDTIVSTDHIITQIRKDITYKVEAAVITADGAVIGILNNAEEANGLLQEIRDEYVPENAAVTSSFTQDVQVQLAFVDSEEIMTVDDAREKFTATTDSTKPYVIQPGDSIYKITGNADMTVEKFLEINPGMTIETPVVAGQTVNIIAKNTFLSVKTVETATYTEKAEKQVEYRTDSTKSKSYRKVIQQGKDGQKEVTVQIIRINGFEEEQKVVSEKITQEPVNEIIVTGTQ